LIVDFVFRGKTIINGRVVDSTIIIDNGVIIGVHGPSYPIKSEVELNYSSRASIIALPGAIDLHTHLRGLRLSYKEDEYTGTRAAAKGGFTVVVDMPNTLPPVNNKASALMKLEELSKNAIVDYGLYLGVPENSEEVYKLLELRDEIIGFKVYPQDYNKKTLAEVFEEAKKNNLLIIVHAEEPSLIKENPIPGYRWLTRTIEAELYAIERMGRIANKVGFPKIHITHITSSYAAHLAKMYGFSFDTAPHYLLLNSNTEKEKKALAKVNPPLRPEPIRFALLENFKGGIIDAIATDHAPHTLEEKCKPFKDAPAGIPGLETTIPLLLTMFHRGWISLSTLSKVISEVPAEIIGLNNAGKIAPGYIGNLTIVDLSREFIVKPEDFESKAKHTPFEKFKCRGKPIGSIVRGRIVYLDGEFHADRGYGINITKYHKYYKEG